MRSYIILMGLALSAAPAGAQLQDLIRQGQQGAALPDRPVTLALRGVALKEAVAKLSEAAEVALSCAPALAERRVSITCRARRAAEIAQGLACAVSGRWREEGKGFVLEPADPVGLLRPEELACEMGCAAVQSGAPAGGNPYRVQDELPDGFAPGQRETASTEAGLAFGELPPEQQRRLAWLLAHDVATGLRLLASNLLGAEQPDGFTVELQIKKDTPPPFSPESLMIRGPSLMYMIGFPPRPQ